MPARIASLVPAHLFRPSWSPISSPGRAPSVFSRSIFMPAKSKASSIYQQTITFPPTLVRDIKEQLELHNVMVVSPDVGGVFRARALAKRIDAPLAIVDKRRERAGNSEVMNIIGDVAGETYILVGDIINLGGTLCNASDALLAEGAQEVYAYITHGVLSGGAVAQIAVSQLKELVLARQRSKTTEAIRVSNDIRIVSIAPLIGEAIARTAKEESVSSLFDSSAWREKCS